VILSPTEQRHPPLVTVFVADTVVVVVTVVDTVAVSVTCTVLVAGSAFTVRVGLVMVTRFFEDTVVVDGGLLPPCPQPGQRSASGGTSVPQLGSAGGAPISCTSSWWRQRTP
jgi:hypothetical protein